MAQTGYSKVQIYSSSTATNTPSAGNLTNDTNGSELAINITDGKLFYKDNSGTVQVLATKGTGSVGGSTTQVQYNSSGTFAGSANLTFDGTTLTSSGFSGPLNGTVGAITANTGSFTTLSASSTVSGTGFSTYLASPPAIGGTTAAAGSFTNLAYTGTLTGATGIVNLGSGQFYKDASGNVGIGTSSPAVKLHVLGSSESAIFASTNATLNYTEYRYNTTTTNGYIGNGGILTGSGTATDFVVRSEAALAFATNGATERVRIDVNGNLMVGTTSTGGVGTSILSNNGQCLILQNTSSTTANTMTQFRNPNGIVGQIICTGSTTAYNTSSDYRLKEDIAPMTGALAKVVALKPVTYKWKVDGSNGEGFIAHELQEVVAGCVSGEKDAVDANGNPIYQGIDTSFLVATLTAAIQELSAQVTTLQTQVTALKG
jgi:hypothetical protein